MVLTVNICSRRVSCSCETQQKCDECELDWNQFSAFLFGIENNNNNYAQDTQTKLVLYRFHILIVSKKPSISWSFAIEIDQNIEWREFRYVSQALQSQNVTFESHLRQKSYSVFHSVWLWWCSSRYGGTSPC